MSGDVTFAYTSGGQPVIRTLKWADRIASREALGIWKVGEHSWKVYNTRKELVALTEDYHRAAVDAGLPMGGPSFLEGTVKRGDAQSTAGFALITEWMTGVNFQKTAASFKTALTREKFSKDRQSADYKRMAAGTFAANKVGLRDCQGFVKAKIFEPLRFIDVHTSWNSKTGSYGHSELAQQLMETADKWGEWPDEPE